MNLRVIVILACSFLLISCNYFTNKKGTSANLIDTVIDFNSVDAYPLFSKCADIPSREKQKICFQIKLSEHMNGLLNKINFSSLQDVNDTVLVDLLISNKGLTSVISIKESTLVTKSFPKLDSLIKVSVSKLPNLEPAIKRGIPVGTKFTLPIIINNLGLTF